MPLRKGISKKAREKSIEELIRAGHPPDQAAAIAYSVQRKAKSKGRK